MTELVCQSVESEWRKSVFEWIWEKITRCLNPRWQCLNPRWQNSRWLPSSSWVRMNKWSFFVQNGWIQDGRIARWLPSSIWERMHELKFFCSNGWIQDGRFQDGCHHQVESEWMSLSQIELVWVRVRMEWECFWVNLREDNKWSESKMAVSESKMGRIQDGCHHQVESEWMSEVFFLCKIAESIMAEFKMAAIIKLSENEWMKFFLYKMAASRMADFNIAAIIKLSQNEWVKFFLCKMAESMMAEFKMAAYHQVESEWMSLSQIELVWVRVLCKMAESKMAEFKMEELKMVAIIKLIRLN